MRFVFAAVRGWRAGTRVVALIGTAVAAWCVSISCGDSPTGGFPPCRMRSNPRVSRTTGMTRPSLVWWRGKSGTGFGWVGHVTRRGGLRGFDGGALLARQRRWKLTIGMGSRSRWDRAGRSRLWDGILAAASDSRRRRFFDRAFWLGGRGCPGFLWVVVGVGVAVFHSRTTVMPTPATIHHAASPQSRRILSSCRAAA